LHLGIGVLVGETINRHRKGKLGQMQWPMPWKKNILTEYTNEGVATIGMWE